MDAFAVSVGLGAKYGVSAAYARRLPFLAFLAGVYFGVSQGAMPLLGYLGGKGIFGWLDAWAPWLAAFLLFFIGGKMIFDAFLDQPEPDGQVDSAFIQEAAVLRPLTHRAMLALAIATSIDALAAGFALHVLPVAPMIACLVIGVITFLMSAIGVFVGRGAGTWLESKAELLGGAVLLLIGLKIMAVPLL